MSDDVGTIQFKDPDNRKRFPWNWAAWLGQDTIVASEFIVPDGLAAVDEDFTTTTAEVWLTGGTLGADYEVTNRITTAAGATEDRTMTIKVRKR